MSVRWSDLAEWRGLPANNFGDGDYTPDEPADRMTDHRGLVVHIAEGSYDGTISWEHNSRSDVSSHLVVARDGRCAQMLSMDDRSWCQKTGNAGWLSVECEGRLPQALTTAQCETLARIMVRAHRDYGIPLETTSSSTGRGLGYHSMGGASWGHIACPGSAIIAQLPGIVARAREMAGQPSTTPPPQPPSSGPTRLKVDGQLGPLTITRWQQIMHTPVDGIISPVSELVMAVQRHLNAHGTRPTLDVDGRGIRQDGREYKTVRALQRYLGTVADGVMDRGDSSVVRALQRRLNEGRF